MAYITPAYHITAPMAIKAVASLMAMEYFIVRLSTAMTPDGNATSRSMILSSPGNFVFASRELLMNSTTNSSESTMKNGSELLAHQIALGHRYWKACPFSDICIRM